MYFLFAGASLTVDDLARLVRQSEQWRTVKYEAVSACVLSLVHSGVLQKSNNITGPGLLVSLLVSIQEVDEWSRIPVSAYSD